MSMTKSLLPLIFALATCWAKNPIFNDVPPQLFQETLQDDLNFRLPNNVIPTHYDITLKPVFDTDNDNFTFAGTSVINLEVMKSTNEIIFHAEDLDIPYASIRINNSKEIEISEKNRAKDEIKERSFVKLILEKEVVKDVPLQLSLNFTGKLRNDLRGFYRSSYEENGEKVWLGTTHFEPVSARKAFPCWDEPAIKANFTITIVTPENSSVKYHAISNMNINKKESENNTFIFETSPKMPAYLVAFVVSNYTKNTNKNGDFTVWTKPQAIDSTNFALEFGQEALKKLENYTDIEYKTHQGMSKLDQISIPDFAAGAMENWGLVTYRESALLYTENKTTTESKQSIATVIAHEFAHQWFGNLVTCEWWDYIWLNEGFATFFQYFITDKVMQNRKEDWRLMEQFVIKNLQASAFVVDANIKTRALNPKITAKTPDQVSSLFDDIAYKKGASIIRMMQQFLGEEIFQNGLKKYLNDNSFEAVNSDNLFDAIQEIVQDPKNIPKDVLKNHTLKEIMKNWVKEPGYPVVTVTRKESDLNLKQNRFLLGKKPIKDEIEWYIFGDYIEQDNIVEKKKYLLKPGEQLNITKVVDAKKWVLFNTDQTGYYRVNYDDENWGLLTAFLKSENYTDITEVNRAQLIDDALNLARGGYLKYDVSLSITAYLSQETDYIPWYAAIRAFNYLDNVLQSEKETYHKYVAEKIVAFAKSVNYEDPYNGTHVDKLAKVLALNTACKYGLEDCNKFAENELSAYLNNEKSLSTDLRSGILCAGLRATSNETLRDLVLNRLNTTTDEDEKAEIWAGLGCITSKEFINKFLNSTLGTDSLFKALNSVCTGNAASFDILIKFITDNIETIQNGNQDALVAHFNKLASRVTTIDQYAEIMSLATRVLSEEASVNEGSSNALENINWIKLYKEEVVQWITENSKGQPEPPPPEPLSANSLTLTSFLVIIPVLLTRL